MDYDDDIWNILTKIKNDTDSGSSCSSGDKNISNTKSSGSVNSLDIGNIDINKTICRSKTIIR